MLSRSSVATARSVARASAPRSARPTASVSTCARVSPSPSLASSSRIVPRSRESARRPAVRTFSTTSPARAADEDVVEDPEHPSGIFFHKLDGNRFAMTLFPDKPSSPTSASVMAVVTKPSSGKESEMPIYELAVRKPDLAETNKAFIDLMHQTLKEEGVPNDGLIEYEAVLRKDGWAHVSDQRHPLMPGRIPTPENIIASVAFTDGSIIFDSYERNDTYRLITSEEGITQLRPAWLDLVKKRCRQHM